MVQLTDSIWAVQVPDDAKITNVTEWSLYYQSVNRIYFIHLPPGTWQYLFTTKGCTEEDARKVVGSQYLIPLAQLHVLLDEKGCDINKNYAILKLN